MNATSPELMVVRRDTDALDGELLSLLADRQCLVERASKLKPKGNPQAVADPQRVAEVIAARRKAAAEIGLDPTVAEAIWRAMIQAFIRLELRVNAEEAPTE